MNTRHVPPAERSIARSWAKGAVAGVIAIALGALASQLHRRNGWKFHSTALAWIAVIFMVIAGVYAVNKLADAIALGVSRRLYPAAGAVVRLLLTGFGYVVVILSAFGVLGVSVERLLIGAGVAGVVLGIAAQQSLGNIFASLVLLFARPFRVGDHIRLRSGVTGQVEAWVLDIGLTYVTLQTDEGILKVPNSIVLGSGIGQLTPAPPPDFPIAADDEDSDKTDS